MGVVDIARLFAAYPGTKAAQIRYEAAAREKERALEKEKKEIRKRRADHEKRKSSLSKKERQAAEKELKDLEEAHDARVEAALAELKEREERISRDVVFEIREYVAKAAKKRKIELVFDKDKVVWAERAQDLTRDVLESFEPEREKKKP